MCAASKNNLGQLMLCSPPLLFPQSKNYIISIHVPALSHTPKPHELLAPSLLQHKYHQTRPSRDFFLLSPIYDYAVPKSQHVALMSADPKIKVTSLCSPAVSLFPSPKKPLSSSCPARSFHSAYYTTRLGCGIKVAGSFLPKALIYQPQATSLRNQNLHVLIVMSASTKTMRHCGMVSAALPLARPISNDIFEDAMTSTGSVDLATLLLYRGSLQI